MKQKFDVTGMTCSACSAHVEKAVNKLEGVRRAEVSLMTNSMTADFDESVLSADDIIQAVKASGYGASLPARAGAKAEERRAMAVAREQEMKAAAQEQRAKVIEAEAEVPRAMAAALREGKLGVMDYYEMKNTIADTAMRDSIASMGEGANAPRKK